MVDLFTGAPPTVRPLLDRVVAAADADPRIVGVLAGGSAAAGIMDEFSDLDLVVVTTDEDHLAVLRDARALAAALGEVVAAFTGEHVGEPRLLIALIGSPPLKVDLKIVGPTDLESRVEDGLVVWQRDGRLDAALARSDATWPTPDPQWLEDRFWLWVYDTVAKIGRGELFDCLNMLSFMRQTVLGPLIAQQRGHRPSGVRRLETIAPDLTPALEATLGTHDRAGCLSAVRATVELYLRVRGDGVPARAKAEAEARTYLDLIAARFG